MEAELDWLSVSLLMSIVSVQIRMFPYINDTLLKRVKKESNPKNRLCRSTIVPTIHLTRLFYFFL